MSALESSTPEKTAPSDDRQISSDMKRRAQDVRRFRDDYRALMEKTGFSSKSSTAEIIRWIDTMELTDDASNQQSIKWREDFIRKSGALVISEGEKLFLEFTAAMEQAKPYISAASYKRWFDRLYDTREQSASASSFALKLRWVRSELKPFAERWKQVAQERDKLVKSSEFDDLVNLDPTLGIIKNREAFLDLHYNTRKGLIAQANGLLLSSKKLQVNLYSKAKEKLQIASGGKYLADGKVGVWLERIFKSKANPKAIEQFVSGSGANSLTALMQSWAAVKVRYDGVRKKFSERWEQTGVRGFELFSETQFLSLHYTQRLRYVEQAEDRLDGANDIDNEAPVLIKLRHAMDIRDWDEALLLVMEAKKAQLSEKDFRRLKSMESYVNQFMGSEKKEQLLSAEHAKKRIDELVKNHVPSPLKDLVLRLLRGPNANRSLHQLRWIQYNNIWCRTHGYLDQDRAKQASSDENTKRTKERAKSGLDIGRNDVLTHETAQSEFVRKEEHSKHTATVLSVDLESTEALSTTAEMMEREQPPNRLYWTTLNCFDGNGPTNESWNRDLLTVLTELRGLTRSIGAAGYRYVSPNESLQAAI